MTGKQLSGRAKNKIKSKLEELKIKKN